LHEGSQSWATLKQHLDRSTQSGGHRDRGPKGYERSDERIREAVCEMLTDDHDIDASEITVDVNQGQVTLTGTVQDRRIKFLVEDRVALCAGVKDVHNKLHSTRPM
jgi:osmotically-inducible protein OsmY